MSLERGCRKLVCFPYAGGNSASYNALRSRLEGKFDVVTVELPGRGRRAAEPLRRRLFDLVDDAYEATAVHRRDPFAFFGHSMGASIAFELTRRLAKEGSTLPRHLIVSGRQAPSLPNKFRRWDLGRREFLDMLRDLGGCPPELLDHEELLEFFEPVLRADFEAVERHPAQPSMPMPVPITVLIGERDEVTRDEARPWQQESIYETSHFILPGNHFFLFDQWQTVAEIIAARLRWSHPLPLHAAVAASVERRLA